MPEISPRASASQYGEPSPVSAGTKWTPPVDSTERASASVSAASAIIPSPSRSHWTAAPVTKTAPSSAVTPGWAAAVRRMPCGGGPPSSPWFASTKLPVP